MSLLSNQRGKHPVVPEKRLALGITIRLLVVFVAASVTLSAQTERFEGRLATVPIDRITAPTTTGQGEAKATLTGNELKLQATFEGLSSPATVAHVHHAPPGRRGPVVFTVDIPNGTEGDTEDSITLDDVQRRTLREGHYYFQIHTENNSGGEIRGWLLPQQ